MQRHSANQARFRNTAEGEIGVINEPMGRVVR